MNGVVLCTYVYISMNERSSSHEGRKKEVKEKETEGGEAQIKTPRWERYSELSVTLQRNISLGKFFPSLDRKVRRKVKKNNVRSNHCRSLGRQTPEGSP